MITSPSRLSYSAVNSYSECGQRFLLERGYGVRGGTWYATIAGSVIHEITEAMDRKEFGQDVEVPDFKTLFLKEVQRHADEGIEVKASGRTLNSIGWGGGPNKKDVEWWLIYGPKIPPLWEEWKNQNGWKIAVMPDGEPGIEVSYLEEFGEETSRGYIDRIFLTPNGDLVIIDLKTGKKPESQLQLGDYAHGVWKKYGLRAEWGAYWYVFQPKGSKELASRHTDPVDLTMYSDEYVENRYEMARRGIEAGVFLPNVTSMCIGCGVRKYCRAVGGDEAMRFPVKDEIRRAEVEAVRRPSEPTLEHARALIDGLKLESYVVPEGAKAVWRNTPSLGPDSPA